MLSLALSIFIHFNQLACIILFILVYQIGLPALSVKLFHTRLLRSFLLFLSSVMVLLAVNVKVSLIPS